MIHITHRHTWAGMACVAALSVGLGCGGANEAQEPANSPTATTKTTSANVIGPQGTYDRSYDPNASNASDIPAANMPGTYNPGVSATGPAMAGRTENLAPQNGQLPMADTPLTDGQIAGIISAIDDAEIDAGRYAVTRATLPAVRAFAQKMVQDHSTLDRKVDGMARTQHFAITDSQIADQLRGQAATDKQALMAKGGGGFDEAYIDAMVKGHEDALRLFDDRLIPNAGSDAFLAELDSARAEVAEHLRMAKEVQAQMR